MADPFGADGSRRATDDQWRVLLSECSYLVGALESAGAYVLRRVERAQPPRDGYPTSSMPENSSLGSRRVGDPTGSTVAQRAGGVEERRDPVTNELTREATPDDWGDAYTPEMMSARRMELAAQRAANKLAAAVEAAAGDSMPPIERVGTKDDWYVVTTTLELHMAELIDRGPVREEEPSARRRMEGAVTDAKGALREAFTHMNRLLDTPLPAQDPDRCPTCNETRESITWFGANPHQWIKSVKMCRTDATRKARQKAKKGAA